MEGRFSAVIMMVGISFEDCFVMHTFNYFFLEQAFDGNSEAKAKVSCHFSAMVKLKGLSGENQLVAPSGLLRVVDRHENERLWQRRPNLQNRSQSFPALIS